MRIPPRLVELTPEGKILSSLIGGGRSYSALKEKTGLSDRWLSRKLEDLKARDIIEKRGDLYQAKRIAAVLDLLHDALEVADSVPMLLRSLVLLQHVDERVGSLGDERGLLVEDVEEFLLMGEEG